MTSSRHPCPLEADGHDAKINGFIVLRKRLLQVRCGFRLVFIIPHLYIIKECDRFGSVTISGRRKMWIFVLMSLCCSGVQQEMKILQYFQPARLKPLSQRLRVAEDSFSGFSFAFCSDMFQMSVKLDEILQTQKLQLWYRDGRWWRGVVESRSLCILEAALPAPLRLMGATATGPAATFTTARKQLTSRALPWSHNSLWCPMSSFSTRFHPLQEASYNGDGIRHTAATEGEQNTESSQSRSQKFQTGSLISFRGGETKPSLK